MSICSYAIDGGNTVAAGATAGAAAATGRGSMQFEYTLMRFRFKHVSCV